MALIAGRSPLVKQPVRGLLESCSCGLYFFASLGLEARMLYAECLVVTVLNARLTLEMIQVLVGEVNLFP